MQLRASLLQSLFVAAGSLLLLPSPSLAVDGVLEISQTCATLTGCFSGDSAGFPVDIDGTAGASYRLTSNLVLPDENSSGIALAASGINVDLNGFEIIRAACVGSTTNCAPVSGTSYGVRVDDFVNRYDVSIRNGSITGMGSYAILGGQNSKVTNVRVRWNRLIGIFASSGSIVSGNTSRENGADGIRCDNGCLVESNTSRGNTGYGIFVGAGSGYRGNVVSSNTAGSVSGGLNLGGNACNGVACP